MASRETEILVVGAGLQGCAIALFLARAGKQVTIVEKNLAGRHASGVNAGGLRALMRDIREYPLSLRAMEHWETLAALVGPAGAEAAEVRLGTSQIAVALDEAELAWTRERAADMRRQGIETEELLTRDEVMALLPGLTSAALGGLMSRRDGHANPANAARAFHDAAVAAGAAVIERCPLQTLSPQAGGRWLAETGAGTVAARTVINCGGAWGAQVAALVGETLPLRAAALSMMVTERVAPFVTPVVLGIDRPLSFKQSAAGSLVIGGGILGKPCPEADTSFSIMDRMPRAAAATIEAFPALAGVQALRTWTGLEGATPDGVPIIGPSARHANLWHVFGFCGHGFQLSPAVGETVARSVLTGDIDPLITPFGVCCFS